MDQVYARLRARRSLFTKHHTSPFAICPITRNSAHRINKIGQNLLTPLLYSYRLPPAVRRTSVRTELQLRQRHYRLLKSAPPRFVSSSPAVRRTSVRAELQLRQSAPPPLESTTPRFVSSSPAVRRTSVRADLQLRQSSPPPLESTIFRFVSSSPVFAHPAQVPHGTRPAKVRATKSASFSFNPTTPSR